MPLMLKKTTSLTIPATNLTHISADSTSSRYPLPAWSTIPAGQRVVHPPPYAFPAPRLQPIATPPPLTTVPLEMPSSANDQDSHVDHPIPTRRGLRIVDPPQHGPKIKRPSAAKRQSAPLEPLFSTASTSRLIAPRGGSVQPTSISHPDPPIPASQPTTLPHDVSTAFVSGTATPLPPAGRPSSNRPRRRSILLPTQLERRHSVPVFWIPDSELAELSEGGETAYQEIKKRCTPAGWLPTSPEALQVRLD